LADALGLGDQDRAALRTVGAHKAAVANATARSASSVLPLKLTSFVGHTHELTELRHRLEVSRLVSLVGMGGIGKTRLTLEAARGLGSRYADGVVLADLAPLAAPELVVQAVAFEWCLEADPDAGLQLIGVTRYVLWRRSFAEGRRWARAFLERCPEPSPARVRALASAGLFEVLGDPAEARRLLSEARRLAARSDEVELAAVDFYLGLGAWMVEDIDRAIRHLECALTLMERARETTVAAS
jgi:hypothetical protein